MGDIGGYQVREIQGSVGVWEIKGKVQVIYRSHSPQRSYHSVLPTRDKLHHTPMYSKEASRPEKPGKVNYTKVPKQNK